MKPLRHPDVVWRSEKRREEAAVQALEAGEDISGRGTVTLILSGMMHQLNLVGGRIWACCDGTRTIQQIAGELAGEFAAEPQELVADVEEFVTDLKHRGWLIDG